MTVSIEQLLSEIGSLNNKLILIVGPSGSGKTQLLRQLGNNLQIVPLNVGLELGRRLAAMPTSKRGFSAGELLREMADQNRTEKPLLLDNLELLFEPSLHVNPLDLVRRLAHAKPVVVVWPGELSCDRLDLRLKKLRNKKEYGAEHEIPRPDSVRADRIRHPIA